MWLCMLDLLLLWHLARSSFTNYCLLLAHWSLDNNLWWSVSVVEVLWLRQSQHPQAPAGCHGCICNDIWRISDTSVYVIHMQLCSLGAPVDWSCINHLLSGWLNLSCSIWHLNWTHESVPDCEIFPVPPDLRYDRSFSSWCWWAISITHWPPLYSMSQVFWNTLFSPTLTLIGSVT